MVNLWAEAKVRQIKYPSYVISDSAGARLRILEQRIAAVRGSGALTPESCNAFANRRESDFVFHSIKIEGSGLTRGFFALFASSRLLRTALSPLRREGRKENAKQIVWLRLGCSVFIGGFIRSEIFGLRLGSYCCFSASTFSLEPKTTSLSPT